jgi:hypothetical protein
MLFTLTSKIRNIILLFKNRIFSDLGRFEAENCLYTQLNGLEYKGLLDSASLVITPNGYEETKLFSVVPNDGTTDFAVTRATVATRVNSQGLLETVPYNQLQYTSQLENSTFTKRNVTITNNTLTDPNNSNTAYNIVGNSGVTYSYAGSTSITSIISEGFANTLFNPFIGNASVYLKYNGLNSVRFILSVSTSLNLTTLVFVQVNLQSGEITNSQLTSSDGLTNISNSFIENVGNGWFRIGFKILTASSTTNNRLAVSLGDTIKTTGNGVDGVYIWGLQLTVGGNVQDYWPTSTRINIPRLDYSGTTCPTLLTEPQLTNSWTNNNITSGYTNNTNAIQVATIPNAFGEGFDGFDYNFSSGTFLSSTFSIRQFDTRGFPIQRLCFFVKNPSSDFFGINYTNATQVIYQFSTLTARDYYLSGNTGTITKINENTYALYMHMDNASTGQFSQVRVGFVGDLTSQVPITGSTILGLGYQQGAAAGSTLPLTYNPITTGASSVTKNAETLTKVGIENLIGQTEGTLLVKGYQFDRGIVLRIRNSGSTTLNRIAIFCASNDGKVECAITKNGTAVNSTVLTSPIVFKKNIAFVYSNLGFKVFINGAIIFTHTYATQTDFTAVLNELNLGSVSERATARFELVALWKTQLTDEQVIQLTTL